MVFALHCGPSAAFLLIVGDSCRACWLIMMGLNKLLSDVGNHRKDIQLRLQGYAGLCITPLHLIVLSWWCGLCGSLQLLSAQADASCHNSHADDSVSLPDLSPRLG